MIMMKKILCGLLMLAMLLACLPLSAMAADNIAFTETKVTLFEGETHQMMVTRNGVTADGTLEFSASSRVITVDENGLVTANKEGNATVTAKVKVNNRTYSCNCSVTVKRAVTEIVVKEDNLTVTTYDDPNLAGLLAVPEDPDDPVLALQELPVLVVNLGREVEFNAYCNPRDASNRRWKLMTSDEKIAKVTSSSLRPVSAGECVLTFYSDSNPEVAKQYRVLVLKPVTGVTIESDSKIVFVGESLQLRAVTKPDDASIPGVVWSSENEKNAVVDENGVVTGLARGQATIRATAADGSKRYNRLTINVQQKAESITLDKTELNLSVGSGKSLHATVLPNNTSDKNVVWTSSDPDVARVNSSGYITPVSRGTCVITCSSKVAPDVYAEAYINVIQPVTRIKFTESSTTVAVGSAVGILWTVEPNNATDASVTLTSSNEKIATVDQYGFVYGVKRGECTITAKANDGSGKTARITVKVTQPVLGVHMKNDTVTVGVHEGATIHAELEPSDASNNHMTWYSADTRIATVSGKTNKPTVTGQAWGSTLVYGTTEDGGYTTSCIVNVGNYDKALKITDLYLLNNAVKIVVLNESNMNITRFNFTVELYDFQDLPIACNPNGSNRIDGSYNNTMYEGESTQHGRFNFGEFYQPETQIAKLVMRITGYRTDDGYRRNIAENKQPTLVYESPVYVGPSAPGDETTDVEWVNPKPETTPGTEDTEPKVVSVKAPEAGIPVLNVHLDRNNGKYPYAAVVPVALSVDENNNVKVTLQNNSEATVKSVKFEIELFDGEDFVLLCSSAEVSNVINARYNGQLGPDAKTSADAISFQNYVKPTDRIEYALVRILSYTLVNDEAVYIPQEYQPMMEYRTGSYNGNGHLPGYITH